MDFTRRDIYLKIEPLKNYSPLAPVPCARRYGRDCMFNIGHELGRVTAQEISEASLDALVYREYLDPHYAVPNTSKLIPADVNEPAWNRRVPGSLLYARIGERLHIHVLNGDPDDCHSFHLHGLRYGIDSDGAWPFGVASRDGRRSDEIKPGHTWTYVFDVTSEMVGGWSFHDHVREVQRNVNRGLFGGLIVRDPSAPCPDHEVPLFIHQLQGSQGFFFRSDTIPAKPPAPAPANTFSPPPQVFDHPGTCDYLCAIHGSSMSGKIIVLPQDTTIPAQSHTITMQNLAFIPQTVTIRVGDTVTWVNNDGVDHIVFSPGGGKATFCLNGRAYIGNTPTIVGDTGERLRWYVFNLDLGMMWHNFHPHSVRWQLSLPPGGASDVHALSPVETFVTDTIVPPALRLPCVLEELQCAPPSDACRVRIKGDFLFHCHVEEHMMMGLGGLVRARQQIWITESVRKQIDIELPYDGGLNECPHVDLHRCRPERREPHHGDPAVPGHIHMAGVAAMPMHVTEAATKGAWEVLPCDSQILAVHAAVLHTGKVLFISGSGNSVKNFAARLFRAVVWDYQNGTFKTLQTRTDIFCAGHSFLPNGRLLVVGGTLEYMSGDEKKGTLRGFRGEREAYLFDPILEDFIRVGAMRDGRWYPSLMTLGDGRILIVSGLSATLSPPDAKGNRFSKIDEDHEIYTEAGGLVLNGTLQKDKQARDKNATWPLYPHLFVMRDGRLFYSGAHVFGSNQLLPGWLTVPTNAFRSLSVTADFDLDHRDQAASVLLPPAQDQRVMVIGGGGEDPEVGTDKVHIIDLLKPTPAYKAAKKLNHPRMHLNAVLLPDRTVLVSGGEREIEKPDQKALEAEIYHPASNTWSLAAKASVPRMYHSIAMLLPDGRVITAGSNPESADPGGGELRLELYHPPYLFRGPRPFIVHMPQDAHYGATIEIHTPQAEKIKWVEVIRPMATTHSWDSNQRLVDLPFRRHGVCHLEARIPDNPNLVPPGWYMLFIVDTDGVPSVATWVRLSGKDDLPHLHVHRQARRRAASPTKIRDRATLPLRG